MKELNNEYKTWLETLGFAESSVKSLPMYIAEMLRYFEQNNITAVNQITAEAINNFIKFLKATGKNPIDLKLMREKTQSKIPQVLTQAEIRALYEATYNNARRVNTTAYGQRDRAMLAVYYGCGLRRSEGNNLQLSDILYEKKLIYVRKGKGNKERLVPICT